VFAHVQPDGMLLNEARFTVRTDSGAELHVHCEAILAAHTADAGGAPYLRSVLRLRPETVIWRG